MSHENCVKYLKIFFGLMCLSMIYLVIATSLKSNFFEVLPSLNQEPWFVTTIIDFYFNIAIISAWAIYKERTLGAAVAWVVGFVLLGSIATSLYVLLQLAKLKKGEPFAKALLRKDSSS